MASAGTKSIPCVPNTGASGNVMSAGRRLPNGSEISDGLNTNRSDAEITRISTSPCSSRLVFTGLLANGGGFLVVPLYLPLYLLIFGLGMRQAVGTSLLVIIVLAIPTLVTHWLLGHINWALAGEFALGQVPGSAVGSQFAHHVQGPVIRRAFGLFLIAFGLFFTIDRIVAH